MTGQKITLKGILRTQFTRCVTIATKVQVIFLAAPVTSIEKVNTCGLFFNQFLYFIS